tara:strand:+ start:2442 stop:3179 length:738 start_codon:yes stop_codon:yes gene_type:complete
MKYLIIGDVHGSYDGYNRAVTYGQKHGMHIVSVGDLVDNGPDGFKIVRSFNKLVNEGDASFIIGNHEWKIYRWTLGRDVLITPPNKITTDEMTTTPKFKEVFAELMNKAQNYIQLNERMFVTHAAMSKEFWTGREVTKYDRERMMYGFADRSTLYQYRGETYPIRLYDWVEWIPNGVKLFVGHDPRPMIGVPDFNNFQLTPLTVKNKQGGYVTFLDTGSGKGGTLWGAVVNSDTTEIEQLRNFSV